MIKYSGIPDYYIDIDSEGKAKTHKFTDIEKAAPAFKALIETFSDAYFLPEKTPVSLEVNLKVTKEIGDKLKLSFFVNRLFDYNPRYYSRFGVSSQKWVTPFMGAELQIKI
jgi:sulfite reductase alpha subunit-like flavoprotein